MDTEMRRLLSIALLFLSAVCTASPLTSAHLGFFSNQRTTANSDDPHSEGYSVDLYQEGSHVFGKFYISTGIETPSGIIYDAKIDPSTRSITFRAKLSTGTEFTRDSGPQGRPARDFFEFHGVISDSVLKGQLAHRSGYDAKSNVRSESVLLRRIHTNTPSASYAEWSKEPANAPANW